MKEFRLKDIYSKYSANRKSKLHQQFGRATQHIAKKKKMESGPVFYLQKNNVNQCVCMYMSLMYAAVGG